MPSSAEKLTKCRWDKQTQVNERTQGMRKYCHPSFGIPAASDIRQVRQLFGGFLSLITAQLLFFVHVCVAKKEDSSTLKLSDVTVIMKRVFTVSSLRKKNIIS